MGFDAGVSNQQEGAVAVGTQAGQNTQEEFAAAVGANAGEVTQQAYAVAVGFQAGYTNQHPRSIILNAAVTPLQSVDSDRFFVNPIRNLEGGGAGPPYQMFYYPSTNEIVYDGPPP